MTPLLYCIAIAALEGVVFYMLGWLDARDRYAPPRDANGRFSKRGRG